MNKANNRAERKVKKMLKYIDKNGFNLNLICDGLIHHTYNINKNYLGSNFAIFDDGDCRVVIDTVKGTIEASAISDNSFYKETLDKYLLNSINAVLNL